MADQPQGTRHPGIDSNLPSKKWRLIYTGVTIFTAISILLLFLFSRHYSG